MPDLPESYGPGIYITISDDRVRVGNLLFAITSVAPAAVDEILLVPLSRLDGSIPPFAWSSHHAGGLLGQTALEPGQSLSVSVELLPGEYALLVNVPGSCQKLIWTGLTIT